MRHVNTYQVLDKQTITEDTTVDFTIPDNALRASLYWRISNMVGDTTVNVGFYCYLPSGDSVLVNTSGDKSGVDASGYIYCPIPLKAGRLIITITGTSPQADVEAFLACDCEMPL